MNHNKDKQRLGVHRATANDPVCGMDVNPESALGHCEYGGRTYHFCSAHCLDKFRADPAKFSTPANPASPPADQRS